MTEKNFNAEAKIRKVLREWTRYAEFYDTMGDERLDAKADSYRRCIWDIKKILNDRKKWIAKCQKKSSK